MEVDLHSLFGLHVTGCEHLYSLAETPQLPPSPRIGTRITRALLVSKDRRYLFVTPCFCCSSPVLEQGEVLPEEVPGQVASQRVASNAGDETDAVL
jgi:hypothetical protein